MIIFEALTVDFKEVEKRVAVDHTGNSEGSGEWVVNDADDNF